MLIGVDRFIFDSVFSFLGDLVNAVNNVCCFSIFIISGVFGLLVFLFLYLFKKRVILK